MLRRHRGITRDVPWRRCVPEAGTYQKQLQILQHKPGSYHYLIARALTVTAAMVALVPGAQINGWGGWDGLQQNVE